MILCSGALVLFTTKCDSVLPNQVNGGGVLIIWVGGKGVKLSSVISIWGSGGHFIYTDGNNKNLWEMFLQANKYISLFSCSVSLVIIGALFHKGRTISYHGENVCKCM